MLEGTDATKNPAEAGFFVSDPPRNRSSR